MSSISSPPKRPSDEEHPSKLDEKTQSAESDKHARLFFERLERTGQLIDVDFNTDFNTLPPHVTHVRYPDGRIERVGFSSSPHGVR
jgi:hypothetical protein